MNKKINKCYQLSVVGLGVSGASFLRELSAILPNKSNISIKVITCASVLSKHGPYGEDLDHAKLNRNVDTMRNAFQMAESDFYDWLKQYKSDVKLSDKIPRHLYGNYIVEQISQASIEFFEKNIDFSIIKKTVVDLKQEGNGLRLYCSDQSSITCDRVIISIGPQRKMDPYQLEPNNRYFDSVYPLKNLISELDNNSSIGILGSSLSAVEASLAICQKRPDVPVYLCSRSGKLPTVRDDNPSTLPRIFRTEAFSSNPRLTAHDVLGVLDQELGLFSTNYNTIMQDHNLTNIADFERSLNLAELGQCRWKSIIPNMNLAFNEAFLQLNKNEKANFRKIFNGHWMRQRISISLRTAKNLKKYIDNGQITLVLIESVQPCDTGFRLLDRSGASVEVSLLANATGFQKDLRKSDSELLHNLIKTGKLQLDSDGQGYVHPVSCKAIPKQNHLALPIHILGAASEGTYAFTGAVDILSHQASLTAKAILCNLNKIPGIIL